MIADDIILAWQIVGMIISSFVLDQAILKYKNKKGFLSRNLLFAFFFIWSAAILQFFGSFLTILHVPFMNITYYSRFWILNLILLLFREHQFSSFSVLIAVYFFYRFSRYIFDGHEKYLKKSLKDKVMLFVLILILVYGIIYYMMHIPKLPIFFEFFIQVDIYIIIFILTVMFPISLHSIKLISYLAQKDKNYSRVLYLAMMSCFFIAGMIFYVFRNILGVFTGNIYDILLFFGGGSVILANLFSYFSFYSKKNFS